MAIAGYPENAAGESRGSAEHRFLLDDDDGKTVFLRDDGRGKTASTRPYDQHVADALFLLKPLHRILPVMNGRTSC